MSITQTTVDGWAAHLSTSGLRRWWVLATLTHHRDEPAAAHLLAQCLKKNAPLTMSQRAGKALRRITSQPAINAVIDCWLEDKAGETARQLIEERGWRHSDEARWIQFLTKRNLFDDYFVTKLTPLVNNPAAAVILADPEGGGASNAVAGAAADALRQISAQSPVDAVIDCWLEDKAGEIARQLIEEQGWRHSDEARWIQFLTRRHRFDEYYVAELAPMVNNPVIARMLAHSVERGDTCYDYDYDYDYDDNHDDNYVICAAAALGRISAPEAMNAVIDCWLEDKAGETARQVIEERGWRHSDQARWIQFLTKRNRFDEYLVTELAPMVNNPAIARMLAHPEGANASQNAANAAAVALSRISAQPPVDAVIDCWLEDKAGETAQQVIEKRGWRHSDEARWIQFFTKRNLFDDYFVAELASLVNHPAIARMLAHPEGVKASKSAAEAAAAALGHISEAETVDAVIDCWLEKRAGETARQVIEERGWRHSQEARWFLYLAATGRFDEYLAEDFEFQTLRPEFLAVPTALKARIREAVVKAGEVRMNGLFLVEKRAAELTVADAEALVRTNIRNHNWQALAGNFWWLPARQTLDAVQAIIAAKWKPDDADQAALLTRLGELAPLLPTGAPEEPGSLPLNPVYQKWLTSGETGPHSQKSPAELKAMLNDETDPPDQIAALGALCKQGQLDAATVAKAGLSEHWMVRWVAVYFGADLTQAMRVNAAGVEWFRRLTMLKVLWTAKPCEVTRDGLEALREHLARLPDPRAAGGLLLVEAICTHYTAHDIEVEEGARVVIEEDSFELEG